MKLHQTRFWQNYLHYDKIINNCSMRGTVDAYVYYRILQRYRCQNILEIGFYQGQTAGLIAEITDPSAKVTCVDPRPQTELLNFVYPDFKQKISVKTMNSSDLDFDIYDFIVIDGDKSFDVVKHDIQNSVAHLGSGGMILVNEYQKADVNDALMLYMLPSGLVPFLRTDQTLFFHRYTDNRADFLDFELPDPGRQFIRFQNFLLWDHTVLDATTVPCFTDRLDFFDLALKTFDV